MKRPIASSAGKAFKKAMLSMAMLAVFLGTLSPHALSQTQGSAEEELMIVKKRLEGTVGLVRSNYITVVFAQDEKKGIESEMGFSVGPDVQLIRKRRLGEFEAGDVVKVLFDEKMQEYEEKKPDGTLEKGMAIVSRELKSIEFMKRTAKLATGI